MSIFNLRRNMKIKLFMFTKKDDPNRVLSITVTKEEAIEYAHTLIRNNRMPHYQGWCAINDFDYKTQRAWNAYFIQEVSAVEKSQYVITSGTYKLKNIAAILRMFGDCAPIGCSYDEPVEYEHAQYKQSCLDRLAFLEDFWDASNQNKGAENGS